MVPRDRRKGLSILLPRPAALCALKLPSKELLSIRSRRPHHFRAKTLISLQKHIDLLQSAMKGMSLQNGRVGTWGPGMVFPSADGMKGPCSTLHPAVAPEPLNHRHRALQAHGFKRKGIKALISLISLHSFFSQRRSAPRCCLCRSRNENPRELLLSLRNSWQGSRQPR